jgi:hypothetical protein
MPELTVGRIVRMHAALLGILLATALPVFAVSGSPIAAVDDSPILVCMAVVAGSMIRSKVRGLRARWRGPRAFERKEQPLPAS